MPGGLMSLVAIGQQNQRLPRNIAHEYIIYGPAQFNNPINITRDADIIIPEHVKIGFTQPNPNPNPNQPITLDELKAQLRKLSIKLVIGNTTVAYFPLAFLINLNEPEIIDSHVYINLQFDKIFGDIKIIGLQQHQTVNFFIINNEPENPIELLTTWELVSVMTYLDSSERNEMAQNIFEGLIQYIYQMKVNVNNSNLAQTASEFNIQIPFEGLNKGIFIECDNPNNIQEINLYLNGQERFRLDKFLIKSKCKIISPKMIYFPFNYRVNFMDRTFESFVGSTNYSRIDSVKLQVKFNINTPTNQIEIFGLGSNVYKQFSGTESLVYFSGNAYLVRDLQTNYTVPFVSSAGMMKLSKVVFKLQGYKLIDNLDHVFCPISYDEIKTGTQYTSCNICKNNYCVEILSQWLEKKQTNKRNCPICRTDWTNWDAYINDLEPIPNPNNPPPLDTITLEPIIIETINTSMTKLTTDEQIMINATQEIVV